MSEIYPSGRKEILRTSLPTKRTNKLDFLTSHYLYCKLNENESNRCEGQITEQECIK